MNTRAKKLALIGSSMGAALLIAALPFISGAQVTTQLTGYMEMGATGAEVTRLQTLLSTDSTIYPEGLKTGTFGPLTQAAVQKFQCRENIVCSGTAQTTGYGRVGPTTLARLNAYISAGGTIVSGIGNSTTGAPMISNVGVSNAPSGSATLSWNTNESTTGRVFYQTSFPVMVEASAFSAPSVSGSIALSGTTGGSHTVTIPGLSTGTTYYYVIEAKDGQGNVSLTWPTTFQTQ